MTAGKGIVHSERETLEVRGNNHSLNGLQCWMALPEDKADIDPSFVHIPKSALPYIHREKILMRLIAGEAFGKSSPVKTYSPMFYLDVVAEKGAVFERPCGLMETAIYIQMGSVVLADQNFSSGDFVIYDDKDTSLLVTEHSRFIFLGGDAFAKAPYMEWNFVSFDKNKIEEAKRCWQNNEFPCIPGDDEEFIPLSD